MTHDFYVSHYRDLAEPLLAMMLHGIAIDADEASRQRRAIQDRCIEIQDRLDVLTGAMSCTCGHDFSVHFPHKPQPVYTKAGKLKVRQPPATYPCNDCGCLAFNPSGPSLTAERDLSSTRTIHFLYTILGLPKQRKRGEPNVTADEVALRKLLLRVKATKPLTRFTATTPRWKREPAMVVEVLELLLEHREKAKLATYLAPEKRDSDGRLRCHYKVTTENGRLASAKNPMGTGYNLQNVPRGVLRRCFIPDPGCVLLELDYSQIEDRVVKVLSKDETAIKQARLRPDEFDAHTESAQRIFSTVLGVPPAKVDVKVEVSPGNTRRQVAKPFRHGANYAEGAKKVQDTLLTQGVILPLSTCEKLLATAKEPYVLNYQLETRKRIMRHRRLVNSWGRVLDFTGERLNDDTYRRGYAFRAASENADAFNQLGLLPTYHFIKAKGLRSRINLQCHDSMVISCPPDEVYRVARFAVRSMETVREIEGVELSVPVELKMGSSWECEYSWKRLPSRGEMESAAKAIMKERRAA